MRTFSNDLPMGNAWKPSRMGDREQGCVDGENLVISEYVDIKVNSRTYKYYLSLGYEVGRPGTCLTVHYLHLKRFSEERLTIQCDYCGSIFTRTACDHFTISETSEIKMDACACCKGKKSQDAVIEKYGVNSVFELDSVKQKSKETIQRVYGVDYISQSDEIQNRTREHTFEKYGVAHTSKLQSVKDKRAATNRERYGVDYYMQTEEYLIKKKKTCLEKYGFESAMQNEDVKERQRSVMFEHYGVRFPTQHPDIIAKSVRSRYLSGTQTCSKQQKAFHDAIGGELNYPVGRFFIDIALIDDQIAIEYDGSGHDLSVRLGYVSENKFLINENFRRSFFKQNGWKTVRFVSKKDVIPDKNEILRLLDFGKSILNNGDNWVEINLDNDTYSVYGKTNKLESQPA